MLKKAHLHYVKIHVKLVGFKEQNRIPYFIEYSAHFFTMKMMMKYSLRTEHGKKLRKGLEMAFMMNKLAMIISFEIILGKYFFALL